MTAATKTIRILLAVAIALSILSMAPAFCNRLSAREPDPQKPSDEAPLASTHKPVPMIHVTDLYRPYNDPDDHWDLACAYALARRGDADLLGVFIDHPHREQNTDPDVLAVAQMNFLTGKAVPVMVGSPRWIEPEDAAKAENEPALRGIRSLLEILRRSPQPVVISVLGSCRDVALAGRLEPDLFAAKCAAVYLNAGSGTPDEAKAGRLEWNVQLDPRAYAAMFELPCPVYWMPCFEVAPLFHVSEYGTFYRFRQGDVLPHLSDGVQNFFAYMFLQGGSEAGRATAESLRPNWLRYLEGPKNPQLSARVNAMDRNMWCTGGFLHAVGKTVTRDGQIVPLGHAKDPVFTFDPVQITCSEKGVTRWQAGASSPKRLLFHVRDPQQYPAAMTSALKSLLAELP